MIPILSEHDEQAAFLVEARYRYRNDDSFVPELLFAVPNGMWVAGEGKRRAGLIMKYRHEGLKPGVADLHYLQPRGQYPYLVIEMKRSDKKNIRNGGLTDDQMQYLTAARKAGAFVRVCYGAEEAVAALGEYMEMPPS
jgi:hypothetical protein